MRSNVAYPAAAIGGCLVAFVAAAAFGEQDRGGPASFAEDLAPGESPGWLAEDGSVDAEAIPEFTPVADERGHLAGYVHREDLYPEFFGGEDVDPRDVERTVAERGASGDTVENPGEALPVVDEDGQRIGTLPRGGTFEPG